MRKSSLSVTLAGAVLGFILINSTGAVCAEEASISTADVTVHKGALFVNLRAQLIKSGWKPIQMHKSDGYEYSGTETDLVRRNFLEVDSCSTDQGSLCTFYYAKRGSCLRVETVGEEVDSMRVTKRRASCPSIAPEAGTEPRPSS